MFMYVRLYKDFSAVNNKMPMQRHAYTYVKNKFVSTLDTTLKLKKDLNLKIHRYNLNNFCLVRGWTLERYLLKMYHNVLNPQGESSVRDLYIAMIVQHSRKKELTFTANK